MANAIADSLLALLSGAAPAYTNTRARRGQEFRETGMQLQGQKVAAGEKAKDRSLKEKELAGDQDYRSKVLTGQQEEAKATANYREQDLKLKGMEADNKEELARMAQDYQNSLAALRLQTEGLQNVITALHARGTGDKNDKTAEELFQGAASKGLGEIFGDSDIPAEKAQARAALLISQLRSLYGLQAGGDGDTGDPEGKLIAATLIAQRIAKGGNVGGIEPLGYYPRSDISDFNVSPSDSEFEFNMKFNPRLRALAP